MKTTVSRRGFSLIETLVVIGLFSILAIVVSRSVSTTLTGTRKSDATANVRGELNYAINVIDRHLRSAKSIENCSQTGTASTTIWYNDQDGVRTNFSCTPDAACTASSISNVASSSARLTSTQTICITNCQFVCTQPATNQPPTVDVLIQGVSKGVSGVEDVAVEVKTSITLRAY